MCSSKFQSGGRKNVEIVGLLKTFLPILEHHSLLDGTYQYTGINISAQSVKHHSMTSVAQPTEC